VIAISKNCGVPLVGDVRDVVGVQVGVDLLNAAVMRTVEYYNVVASKVSAFPSSRDI
jgi:hypothetical protein